MFDALWIIFALLAVVGKTGYYTLQKRLLDGKKSALSVGRFTIPAAYFDADVTSLELSYIASVYGLLILAPMGAYSYVTSPPDVPWTVWAIVVGLGGLELIGLWMYLHALSLCDMSIASPMKRMKPTFVAVFEPIVLGIPFSGALLAAAASTGFGGYIVLMKGRNLLAPFKRLLEPGPALALGTAVVYAVLSLGSRFGNTRLSPAIFGTLVFGVMAVGYWIILRSKHQTMSARDIARKPFALVGAVGAFRSVMIWSAYALAAATLVSIVAQLTIILDVLVGGKLLHEGNTRQRLLGAVMIFGGVLIAVLISTA